MPWPTLSTERQVEVTCQYMPYLNAETISLIEAAFKEDRFPDYRIPNPAPEAPPVLVVDNHGNYHHPAPTPGDVPADGRGPESAPEQPQAAVDRRRREVRGGDETSPTPRRGRDDVDASTSLSRRCSSAPAAAPAVGPSTNTGGRSENSPDSSSTPPTSSQTPSNRKRQVNPTTVVRGGRSSCPRTSNPSPRHSPRKAKPNRHRRTVPHDSQESTTDPSPNPVPPAAETVRRTPSADSSRGFRFDPTYQGPGSPTGSQESLNH